MTHPMHSKVTLDYLLYDMPLLLPHLSCFSFVSYFCVIVVVVAVVVVYVDDG